ncbi:MAG TPA: lysophospholipid acyltransferase family protein [Mycobacterium sp.]
MTADVNIDAIMNPPARVQKMRRAVDTVQDGLAPLFDVYRPYVDGLQTLPKDGRFLLVGNHTQFGIEALLIPHYVRRAIGTRVRPLAERRMGQMRGAAGDLFAAYGAVVGAPETARELMRHNETILVFPGGGREIAKFKGEEHTLRWQGRSGFARVSVENNYPIVPVALAGADDVYQSLITREGRWGQLSQRLAEKLAGRADMAIPLTRGIGPTLIPRPQRMYLRFGAPIDTTKPARVSEEKWVATVKKTTQESLERAIADLLEIRASDPYRELNPLAWRAAIQPPADA